jgi:UDP-N-acetylmuramate--alanine ligase
MYNAALSFHFVGIGGTGMSGLAEIMLSLGFKVSGSDQKQTAVTERLASLGAYVTYGHRKENLPEHTSTLVYSSAVPMDSAELVEARRRGIPVIRRAEVLAELMRLKFGVAVAGAHGKTTTTSMTAAILEHANLDPTIVIGGQVKSTGTGGKSGKGQFLVAESDESDRSFLLLKPTVAVVTNIDNEHLSAYGSFDDLKNAFEQFVESVPFYGLAVLCIDDMHVRSLAEKITKRKVTYGVSPDAMIQARNIRPGIGGTRYEVWVKNEKFAEITLPMFGTHIAINSLASIAVAMEFGVDATIIQEALKTFSGVARRLEISGTKRGVTVMNDYGHHPTEVMATIRAIKEGFGSELRSLTVIFQPHRYTRTKECFAQFLSAFEHADQLLIMDIYSAGEAPIAGISSQVLCEAIHHENKKHLAGSELSLIASSVVANAASGDVILCLGAGSVGSLPQKVLEVL